MQRSSAENLSNGIHIFVYIFTNTAHTNHFFSLALIYGQRKLCFIHTVAWKKICLFEMVIYVYIYAALGLIDHHRTIKLGLCCAFPPQVNSSVCNISSISCPASTHARWYIYIYIHIHCVWLWVYPFSMVCIRCAYAQERDRAAFSGSAVFRLYDAVGEAYCIDCACCWCCFCCY